MFKIWYLHINFMLYVMVSKCLYSFKEIDCLLFSVVSSIKKKTHFIYYISIQSHDAYNFPVLKELKPNAKTRWLEVIISEVIYFFLSNMV